MTINYKMNFFKSDNYIDAVKYVNYLTDDDIHRYITNLDAKKHCLYAIINNTNVNHGTIWIMLEYIGRCTHYTMEEFILQNNTVYNYVMNTDVNNDTLCWFTHIDYINNFKHSHFVNR